MRFSTFAMFIFVAGAPGMVVAQQTGPAQNLQNEADKGIKTQNSGASSYVADEQKPGSAAHIPGGTSNGESSGQAANAPSAHNSGAGISGAAGNKSGPAAGKGTVGSTSPNLPVQEQDPSNVQGMRGNKSGPPAKR